MFKYIIIVAIFVVNLYFLHKYRSLKSTVLGGIDFTLTGAFLAGYWFGYKIGIIFAFVFMLSYYAISLDFGMHSISNMLVVCILGVIGAFSASIGANILTAALVGIIFHCLLSDIIAIAVLGESDILSLFMFDFGAIFFNYIFFKVFF